MIHHKGTKDTKVSADRLSYDIVGAAIEVHKHLGPGLFDLPIKRASAENSRSEGSGITKKWLSHCSTMESPSIVGTGWTSL